MTIKCAVATLENNDRTPETQTVLDNRWYYTTSALLCQR